MVVEDGKRIRGNPPPFSTILDRWLIQRRAADCFTGVRMKELADVELENDPIYWEMVFNFGRKLYYLNDPIVKANWKTTYQSYLRSKPWQEKADIAKKRAGYRCQLCNSNGEIHVHHRTYERLGNEWQSDLIVLCSKCHAKFHEMEY